MKNMQKSKKLSSYFNIRKLVLVGILCFSMIATGLMLEGLFSEETTEASEQNVKRELDAIQKQIDQIKQNQKNRQNESEQIGQDINKLEGEKKEIQAEVNKIEADIKETEQDIAAQQSEIEQTENELEEAAEQIVEAQEQIEEQDELLKTRIRHMYEQGGQISYLEVILGASSFAELLDRIDFIALIFQQDNKILGDFIANKELIEEKKLEIEELLVVQEEQLGELNKLQQRLAVQKKEHTVKIAQIQEEQDQLHELDEQIQAEMLAMIADLAAKQSQATAHKAELDRLVKERKEREERERREREQQQQAGQNPPAGGQLAWPVPASQRITSNFGMRRHPISGVHRLHGGMDVGAPQGTNIVAAESGVVISAGWQYSYGNTVVIDHGGGMQTLYAHIRNGGINVSVGQTVQRGQKIAEVGSTGDSTGPHLHFEVILNGDRVNPAPYVR